MGRKQVFYQKRRQRQFLSFPLSKSLVAHVNSSTIFTAILRKNCTSISLQSSAAEHFISLHPKRPHLHVHQLKLWYTFFFKWKKKKSLAKVPSAAANLASLATEAAFPQVVFSLRLAGDAVSGNNLCASGNRWARKKHSWSSKRVFSCWWQGMHYIIWLLQTCI